jgi:hypothetical protein
MNGLSKKLLKLQNKQNKMRIKMGLNQIAIDQLHDKIKRLDDFHNDKDNTVSEALSA